MTISRKSTVAAAMMIVVMSGAGLTTLSSAIAGDAKKAETAKTETVKSETSPADLAALKTSDDAFQVMRNVHNARVAIFQGDPVNAARMVVEASHNLDKVKADLMANAKSLETVENSEKKAKTADNSLGNSEDVKKSNHQIVFDARMAIVDDFVVTSEKNDAIAKANEHLKKGEHEKGLEKLKLADIELSVTQYVMPFEQTVKHVKTANLLMSQHKYYEANIALKAVVDGVFAVTNTVVEKPADKSAEPNEKKKKEK